MKKKFQYISGFCSICGVRIPRNFFCSRCYEGFRQAIVAKEPWTKFLVAEEQRRRRRYREAQERNIRFVFIGNELDITPEGRLFRKEGFHNG